MASEIQIFVHAPGHETELLSLPEGSTITVLVEELSKRGRQIDETVLFFQEDGDEEIIAIHRESFPLRHRQHLHHHRCREIQVTVSYNGRSLSHGFRPGATIAKVKTHFVNALGIAPIDAAELALQIAGSTTWPESDVHVGTLSHHCSVAFNLMPKHRVQG